MSRPKIPVAGGIITIHGGEGSELAMFKMMTKIKFYNSIKDENEFRPKLNCYDRVVILRLCCDRNGKSPSLFIVFVSKNYVDDKYKILLSIHVMYSNLITVPDADFPILGR